MQQPRMLTQDMALLLYIISIATLYKMLGWLHNTFCPPPCQERVAVIIREQQRRFLKSQRNWKKDVKKCWQGRRGVVLYLSAKRWAKRTTSSSSARSPWKEPMNVQMFRFVPRNSWTIQAQKVQKLRKKDLTKNYFGGKINRSSAERLRRYRTLKIEQYRKTCKEPLCVWKNT